MRYMQYAYRKISAQRGASLSGRAVDAGGMFGDELGNCKKPCGRIGLEER